MRSINPLKAKNNGILLACLLFLLPVCASSCRESPTPDDEEMIREMSLSFCRMLMTDPNSSKRMKSLANAILIERQNDVINPKPVLLSASLAEPEDRHMTFLVVGISDEDGDLVGIGIRESNSQGRIHPLIIEEEYPVFAHTTTRIASYRVMRVAIRKHDERKNNDDWKKYLASGVWDIYKMPNVWVSAPDPGKIDVEVWIYDQAGHKSELVTLENKMPPADSKKKNQTK